MTRLPSRSVERLIVWALRRYRGSADWEDLLQEARLAVWKALERPNLRHLRPEAVIVQACRWIGLNRRWAAAEGHCGLEEAPERTEPDFAPALIDRLEAERRIAVVMRETTARGRDCFLAYYGGEESTAEIAGRLGLCARAVRERAKRLLARCREVD